MEKIDYFELDRRNILDEYKGLPDEEVRKAIQAKALPFGVLMMNLTGDFNIANVFRTANALGAREVFYYGKKKYDRRGQCGSYIYLSSTFLRSLEEVIALKERYSFVALEQHSKAEPLNSFVWPASKMPLVIVGEESQGLTREILDICDHYVVIEQRGSIRSMNAASAASIAQYDFVSKYQELNNNA